MKISKLSIHALQIPFVERFQHTLKDRSFSDTLVVRVETDSGHIGYGEGLPRPYVTGESVESMIHHVTEVLWPIVAQAEFNPDHILDSLEQFLPRQPAKPPVHAHNAARCAVEIALIDAGLKQNKLGLSHILPSCIPSVTYSGVITSGTPQSVHKRASQLKRIGLSHIKIKVGSKDSVERVAAAREALGDDAVIRIDANSGWSLEQAVSTLNELAKYNIASCEEPLAARQWEQLAELRIATSIPLMADESLVSFEDAKSLIQHNAIDLFNIRLSKCGGIGPSLKLANYARENGLGYQLGAHVGETAILSAAGRQVAAHLGDARFVEGSYGTLLLTEDISRTSLRFGHKGRGLPVRGRGLGPTILEERIEKYTVNRVDKQI